MNKTLIIIGREFTTRVRKRSFLVLTLVVPILLAGFYAFLMWMLLKDDTQDRKIAVINQSVLETPFEQINNNTFEYLNTPVDESGASEFLRQHDYYALISIPENIMDHPEIPVYSFSQVPMELKNEIAAQLRKKIEDIKRAKVIAESQVPDLEEQLSATQTPVLVRTLKITDSGEAKESSSEEIGTLLRTKPAMHRYPGNMGRYLWSAAERLTSEYDGCAENIWGNVTAMESVERLEAFSGISHKKASLACLLLWRDLGVEISDKENIDIAYDVHIRRIFLRAGFCEKDTLKDVTEAARRLNPKFPGYLTSPFWALGRNICRPTEPLCGQCPIRPFCARRLDKTENLRA